MSAAITEQDMRIFLDAVTCYFENTTQHAAEVKPAYLSGAEGLVNYDYTGKINISGDFHGCVYFTAPRVLLKHLLIAMHEFEHHEENMLDLIGEVANTFAGNARRHFGEKFHISVPSSLCGELRKPEDMGNARPFVIPIQWRAYKSALVVCLTGADNH
jgi:chemotaxis protein CheX